MIRGNDLLVKYPSFDEKYLIEGLIENNSLNLLVAPSYTGKTYVALGLCKSICDDANFLDKTVDSGTVLYIDKEMKPKYFAKRLRKLGFINSNKFLYENNPSIDFDDYSSRKQFLDSIRALIKEENLKLIVIDSLNAFSEGYDENSNSSMREVMSFLVEVSSICSVLLIHHVGKGNNNSKLTRDDIRGASCIVDKSDNVFLINALSETERCIFVDKARNHDIKPKPVFFSMTSGENEVLEFIVDTEKEPKRPLKELVLEHFVSGMNRSQLMAHFRNNGMNFTNVELDKVLDNIPDINIEKGPNNSKIYTMI
jgi:archaellum biogenesis ATPase FlaH